MSMKSTKNLKIVLGAVIIGILTITIAYAALSATLNVSVSEVTQQGGLSWKVAFTGSSASATVGGTSDTGRSCGNATISETSVSVGSIELSKPGDSCRYTLTVKNSGNIGAKLSSITPTKPTGTNVTCATATGGTMVCGNITYKLTTDTGGSSPYAANATLAGGASQTLYLHVIYTGTGLNSSEVTQSNAKFTLVYGQN